VILAQICSAIPEIFDQQTKKQTEKVRNSTKNRTLLVRGNNKITKSLKLTAAQ